MSKELSAKNKAKRYMNCRAKPVPRMPAVAETPLTLNLLMQVIKILED